MGTFLLYMIVIALLVMVYLLWQIRTAITYMSGQLGTLVRIQKDREAKEPVPGVKDPVRRMF